MRNVSFMVLPKGSCQNPGVILGFPMLDVEPHGLGWQMSPKGHTFTALRVSLPRLEEER